MLLLLLVFVNYHMNIEIQQREIILFQILDGGVGNLVTNDVIFMLSENVFAISKKVFHCFSFSFGSTVIIFPEKIK